MTAMFSIQQENPTPELDRAIQIGFQQEYPRDSSSSASIGPQIAFTVRKPRSDELGDSDSSNRESSSDDGNDTPHTPRHHEYIAIIVVKHFWGALHIKTLWTHMNYQRNGLATALMKKAEEYALQHKLAFCFVETFSFQALGFYQNKMGYTLEYTRDGYANKASYHYLKKKIEGVVQGTD